MRRRQFDLVEVVALVAFSAVLAVVAVVALTPAPPAHEDDHLWRFPDDVLLEGELAERYGPERDSTHLEEWIARDFFQDMRDGVFADIGAWEWKAHNNTVALERDLGWSGLAVDAVGDYAEGWRANRPRSQFVVAFVDGVDGEPRTLLIPEGASQIASDHTNEAMHDTFVQAYQGPTREVHLTSATLTALLDNAGITRLDFLSLDIELNEPAALGAFDIQRFRPRLVCIEAHPPVRQQILDYFADHDYGVVGRYLRIDNSNLYFAPRDELARMAQR